MNMKNNFYFQHDSNARNDEKILELRCEFGNEAYAIYFMLLESMSETSNGYLNKEAIGGLSLGYNIAKDKLSAIIDKCIELNLFILEKNLFTSKRMQEHLEFRQKLQRAGKKGAKARWSTRQENSHPISHPIGEAYAKGKERKGNNKENSIKENKKSNKLRFPKEDELSQADFEEVAKKYGVPISFVLNEWDSVVNYCYSKNKKYADFKRALMSFVKRDAIERLDNAKKTNYKTAIDASGL